MVESTLSVAACGWKLSRGQHTVVGFDNRLVVHNSGLCICLFFLPMKNGGRYCGDRL